MLADRMREFVYKSYIEPARKQGVPRVTVRAGDVHERMGLSGRMPAVCGAIGAKKFLEQYNVKLVERKSPTQRANVYFTFEI